MHRCLTLLPRGQQKIAPLHLFPIAACLRLIPASLLRQHFPPEACFGPFPRLSLGSARRLKRIAVAQAAQAAQMVALPAGGPPRTVLGAAVLAAPAVLSAP